MRDAFGDVALQTGNGDPSWTLLDRLGTIAAQAVGGSVTQLSTFDDWGNQSFDTIGWNSAVNYTGETTDPGYGLNNYYSRTYDPTTGSWMSQDSCRGLLTQPQTLARFGYVSNSPVRYQDEGGFRISDPSSDTDFHSPDFWIKQEQQADTRAAEIQSVRNAYESARGIPETYFGVDDDWSFGEPWSIEDLIPERHVQGYDEDFPGYQTAAPVEACGSWNAYCATNANEGRTLGGGYCAAAGVNVAFVIHLSGSACSLRTINGERIYPVGWDFAGGLGAKVGANGGLGMILTNANSGADFDGIGPSVTVSIASGYGVSATYSWGTSTTGEFVWAVTIYATAGTDVGALYEWTDLKIGDVIQLGTGDSCRVGQTC